MNDSGIRITKPKRKHKNQTAFKKRVNFIPFISFFVFIAFALIIYLQWPQNGWNRKEKSLEEIKDNVNGAYIIVNNNVPYFTVDDYKLDTFESYSELDKLGRCGVAFANVSKEIMPTEERGEIGNIKPTGWKQAKYEGVVDSTPPYLYNRCHLIAYCLTGENDNEKNLITGTRYLNIEGMLPFEQEVARYLSNNDNHVLYRVTPMYEGNNLLASGILMEAYSIEDKGEGVSFCVYCYNKQPGVEIDYKTGESKLE